ncbi:MAG: SDR family oxidoreductase [Desulfovibrio sp.]|jgi:UDP-glucose 4-epimerase|nr:SDR family oxidoreductase [Desulfovibrio sp.]
MLQSIKAFPAAERARREPGRCLVTGGLGYTGSWISRHLASLGHQVFILSRNCAGAEADFPFTPIRADVERMDCEETARLLPEGLDLVVHAAGLNDSDRPDYPRRSLLVNALGTRNLLAAVLRRTTEAAGGGTPLVVYCSTIHVYGRTGGRITEESPVAPVNDYAATHLFAEEYCRMFTRAHDLPCIVLRLSNGYGAPKSPGGVDRRLLLNDLCASALRDGVLHLRSDPSTQRDFVWLGDYCRVIEALMYRKDLAGRTFNVSSGKSLSIGEVAARTAKTASAVTGREITVLRDAPEGTRQASPAVDNTALRSALGIAFQDRMEAEIEGILRFLQATPAPNPPH